MSRTASRLFLAAMLATFLAASPAFAGEAREALDQAKAKLAAWKKEKDETKKAEIKADFDTFCKLKIDLLAPQTLSRLDTMYLGQLQGVAGMKTDAVATIKKAVASKEASDHAHVIHANLVLAMAEVPDLDGALAELKTFQTTYAGKSEVKPAAMKVGMTARAEGKHAVAAEALGIANDAGEITAVKPLCNSLLLLGKQPDAVKIAKDAIEKGPPQIKEDMLVHAGIVERIGRPAPALTFDAFVPAGEPDLNEKVVVLGFWNMSAKTAKWNLRLMDSIKKGYGDDVATLAVTTYYKKDAESGKIADTVTPDVERGQASQFRDQEGFGGRMAFLKDEASMKEWGVSALPHVVVVAKDRTLLFAHTMNPADDTDRNILKSVLDQALGK